MPDRDPVKLTLRLDRRVIEAAKRYAAEHGTSVSQLVERHLREVAPPPAAEEPEWAKDLHPKVRRIAGIGRAKPGATPVDEEDFWRYLEEKHK